MRPLTTLVLFAAATQFCFATAETNIIATSEWSNPVSHQDHSLRVRMIIAQGRAAAFAGPNPETQFYLEFQNVSAAAGAPIRFYFNPSAGLDCVLQDADGKTPSQGGPGSGGGAGATWITLPYDSTIRLRANMYGYGKKPGDGLLLCLWPPRQFWNIPAGDTKAYFLSGKFTVATPADFVAEDNAAARAVWSGTFDLPKMKISLPKP